MFRTISNVFEFRASGRLTELYLSGRFIGQLIFEENSILDDNSDWFTVFY